MHCVNISIVGKPNVGKSTFLNKLVNSKVAITSNKPQTTRNHIIATKEINGVKFIFNDTPGYHRARNRLDNFLNQQIKKTLKSNNLTLWLIDLVRPIDEEDFEVYKILNDFKVDNILIILTKKDLANQKQIDEKIQFCNSKKIGYLFSDIHSPNDLEQIINHITNFAIEQDLNVTDSYDDDNFMIAETIREQVIFNLNKELPYACGVEIESKNYDPQKNLLSINAALIVEKESQKPIMIGHGGRMIKLLGIKARKALLKIYDCKIMLKLFVKVEKDWRNDLKVLKTLGYYSK